MGFINYVVPAIMYREALRRYPLDADFKSVGEEPSHVPGHQSPFRVRKHGYFVNSVPTWIRKKIHPKKIAGVIAGFLSLLSVGVIVLAIEVGATD